MPPVDAEIRAEVLRERLRLHDRAAPTALFAAATAGVVAALLAAPAVGSSAAALWCAVLLASLLVRGGVRSVQRRRGENVFDEPRRWIVRHRLGFALHGLVWAVLIGMLPPQAQLAETLPVVFIVAAMVGGSLVAASFDRAAAYVFALPPGVMLSAWLGGLLAEPQLPILAACVVFVAMMALVARRAAHMLAAEVRARVAQRGRTQETETARRELAQQVALYRQLLDNTRQGYWQVDLDGRTIDINDAMCRMLGRPRDDVIGHRVLEFFGGGAADVLARELAQRQRGSRGGYTVDIDRPDGTRLHAFNHATPIRDAAGTIVGSIGLWTDLTQVQQLEQDLRIHERVVGSITDAVAVVGADRRYRLANEAWCTALAIDGPSVIDRPADQAIAAIGVPDAAGSALDACLRDGVVGTVTASARLPDGRDTVVQTRMYPYRGGAGGTTIDGAILVMRDIGDHARDRAAVEITAGYLRHTLDATGDAIFANDGDDPHEPVRFANQRMLETFGLTHLTPQALTPAIILEAGERLYRDGAGVRRDIAAIIAAGRRHESQVELLDGRVLHRRFEAAPLAGRTLRVWSFRDITAQQRALQAVAAARDEAQRANEAKSRFLSQMSHELRTPMNAVVGFAQLLLRDDRPPLAPHQRDWSNQVLHGAAHLIELINEVLDLGRIEAGHLTLAPVPVPVLPLVDECLGLVRTIADERGVRLATPDPVTTHGTSSIGGGPAVRADRLRLRQVLLNLLGNAIKYNRPDGTVRVRITLDVDQVVVTVSDTGPGIAPEALPRLFQPFERLDAEHGAIEGSGIGLALSRRLVEAMGGAIEVTSRVGHGSDFAVRLPLVRSEPGTPAPAADGAAAGHGPAGDDAAAAEDDAATVLYIDDNEVNLLLVEAILARAGGLRCRLARDPLEGLALASRLRPDLVLLDIQMPGLDGYGVLARLRAEPATADIPVVAISADATVDERKAAQRAGFDAYLTKPVDVDGLVATVRRFAGRIA